MGPTAAGWARAGATAGLVVALDQAVKQIVVSSLRPEESRDFFIGVELTVVRNKGVAFGALEGGGALLATLIAVSLGALLVYFALHAAERWLWLPVGVLLGGALANLADRAREGAVIDFVDPVAWPAFNLADVAIVAGVLGLLYVIEGPREPAAE